tara:strand:+ start:4616 stop:5569 length:954 start_codon:yes stop_codon:yes gene_type:complete
MFKNISNMTDKDKNILDIPKFLRDLSDTDSQVKTEVTEKKSKIAWPIDKKETKQEVVEKPKSVKPKVDIQARMQAQTSEYLVDVKDIIDCAIEGIKVETVYDFCKEHNIPGAYCSKLLPECECLRYEYTTSLEARSIKVDERTEEQQDLFEAFECYSAKEMKAFIDIHDQAISDLERWSKVKQGEKKARKPRAMSVERMIKKLQYKKDDSKYKLQSVDPILIPRCQQIWVFNTKTRKLAQYNAISRNGILIKGTTLKDFDTGASVSKTVRKPEQILSKIITTDGKIALRNMWDSIKTLETKANGRINSDTILLKVLK